MWRVTDIKKWAMQQRNRNWKYELRMIMAGQRPTVWTGANALGHGLGRHCHVQFKLIQKLSQY